MEDQVDVLDFELTGLVEIQGYPIDEVDEVGKDVFELIAELNIPISLAILGLCRAITMIGSPEDLDMACKIIDQLAEIPYEEFEVEVEEDEEL